MERSVLNSDVFAKMQVNAPYKSYKKTILGQVYVTVIDPFSGQPEGRVLRGDPRKEEEGCIIDVWSQMEDVYFKRQNRFHFEKGYLIPFTRTMTEPERTANEMTDEEIEEVLDAKGFLKLQSVLNKMTSVAPVNRMLLMAEDKEKSDKILNAIKARLHELQTAPAEPKPGEYKEE